MGLCVQVKCANGVLSEGARVQTQWTVEEGGNGQWFTGTINVLHLSEQAAHIKVPPTPLIAFEPPSMH